MKKRHLEKERKRTDIIDIWRKKKRMKESSSHNKRSKAHTKKH